VKLTIQSVIQGTVDDIDQKIDLQNLPIAEGASFGSYIDQHEVECLSGTRTELLQEIRDWVNDPRGKCIYWLNGIAGTGKSTVSRTLAKSFRETKLLGASFFFKRGEGDRGNARRLFPTITGQLVNSIPQLIPGVRKAIEDDPGISGKSLKEQFDKLILQPLHSLEQAGRRTSIMVIVIDALDECEKDNDIRLILQLLPRVQESSSVHLRIFLTSRPELPIRLGFKNLASTDHQDLVLHEIPKLVIEHDISLFLKHRLSEIRKVRSLPRDWPGSINTQTLVMMSVPLFIFAATVCRIFEDAQWDPVDSLAEILAQQNEESKLDRTYLPVLNRLLIEQSKTKKRQLIKEFREVIGTIVILESPLSVISLSKLIGIPKTLIDIRLDLLHSVLSIPSDGTMPVKLFHLSFREFLLDPETREKTPFWVDEKEMHKKLTIQCLNIMRSSLKKNICNLLSYSIQRTEIDTHSINQYLPSELQYSCHYWPWHLVQSQDPVTQMDNTFLFLQEHFLHWVEAMSILGLISEVVGLIDILLSVIQVSFYKSSLLLLMLNNIW
jgi:hypothetical protein